MKKLNYYYGMDACLAFFILLMFCKNAKDSWYVGGAIVGVIFFIMAYYSKTKVINETDNYIKAKPEDVGQPLIDVAPGTEHYGLDGVKSNGKVFKARNGTHIVVKKDGSVTTKSITGKLFNSFLTNAGYITERPDSGWNPLFDSKSSSPGETILKNDA